MIKGFTYPATSAKGVCCVLMIAMFFGFAGRANGQATPLRLELGVCTSVKNIPILKRYNYAFIQPGVQDFLNPRDSAAAPDLGVDFPVYACNGFLPGELKAVGPDADHDGILRYAERAFARAQQAGIGVIVFGSGNSRRIPRGFDRLEAEQQFVDLCIALADRAAVYEVLICLENLNSGETNLINTVSEALSVARRVDRPNFKLLVDIFHMLREEESPSSIIAAGREYVYHIDIAEVAGRTAPGVAGDDFRPYLRALRDISYAGKIALECGFTDMETELPEAMKELQHQLNTL